MEELGDLVSRVVGAGQRGAGGTGPGPRPPPHPRPAAQSSAGRSASKARLSPSSGPGPAGRLGARLICVPVLRALAARGRAESLMRPLPGPRRPRAAASSLVRMPSIVAPLFAYVSSRSLSHAARLSSLVHALACLRAREAVRVSPRAAASWFDRMPSIVASFPLYCSPRSLAQASSSDSRKLLQLLLTVSLPAMTPSRLLSPVSQCPWMLPC